MGISFVWIPNPHRNRVLVLLDEPQHMGDRKRLLPSFHGGRMKDYGAMMSQIVEERVADWRLALLAAFGSRSITANAGFRREMGKLESVVLEEVRLRRARGIAEGEEDIFAMLERGHAQSGQPASDKKMRDELVTMLSDGPTATSLAWVFERLLRYPKKLTRLREEVLRDEGDEYLDACVKETLRLCPAVPLVMRRLIEPMELGGYLLPAGTIVAPCIYLMHRRPDIYRDPLEFKPERFLGGADAGAYTWIPFGGGVRRCVAASFAQLEIKRVIEVVLRQFDLRPATSGDEEAARSSVSFAPGAGARVIATRRAPGPADRQPLAA